MILFIISINLLADVQLEEIVESSIPTPMEYTRDTRNRIAPETDIEWLIVEKAKEWGVRPSLVLEIIKRESGYKWNVCHNEIDCSRGGGLMQIIPSTLAYCEHADRLNRKLDAFSPEDNLDCGLWLLKYEGIVHWEEWSGHYNVDE